MTPATTRPLRDRPRALTTGDDAALVAAQAKRDRKNAKRARLAKGRA